MRGNWPIRVKLFVCLGLLLLAVALLSSVGIYASDAYRDLVRALRVRVAELPVAGQLSHQVSELRITLARLRELTTINSPFIDDDTVKGHAEKCGSEFTFGLNEVRFQLECYRDRLQEKLRTGSRMADNKKEWETVDKIDQTLSRILQAKQDESWIFSVVQIDDMAEKVDDLRDLTDSLPTYLYDKVDKLPQEHRAQYRTLFIGTGIAGTIAALILALLLRLFFGWVLRPLQVLISGSRRVAGGDFDYRIQLDTRDEMAELATALNDMTSRFQDIHDDLENQVEERTRQVVRSEQLASVGFLAAGVAHEINNPLASIALCAESLENRVQETLDEDDDGQAVIGNYLRMIQTEAFRCKEITEKLLDFSRLGEVRHQIADLAQLIQDVIDMLGHLGKYQRRHIEFVHDEAVTAPVNTQEIKQVVLNLLANALDSLEDGGHVTVRLNRRRDFAELTISDNGCGMEPDVLQHIFEPFFTRRRTGQGTGLGLSITYRIISEHDGEIEAYSEGRGKGSTFHVRLPLVEAGKESKNRYQAA